MQLTQDDLKRLLHYDPETGVFTRVVTVGYRGSHKAGRVVGWKSQSGSEHLAVSINHKKHYLHRLAFLYMTGSFPLEVVDHIDGNASNNRWTNLRAVSQKTNVQNIKRAPKNSSTGILGASFNKSRGKFESSVKVVGKRYRGRFETAQEAHEFYLNTKRVVHEGCTI